MERSQEFLLSPEQREHVPEPSIRLEFFRHDEKAKGANDTSIRLTETGRKQATEKGKAKLPNPEVSLVYGSPRERSVETAYRHMLANEDDITPDMSLEDIRETIDTHIKIGKKERTTTKLDFNWSGTPEFSGQAYGHYQKTGDALLFLFEESDALVAQLGDQESTSYSRTAARIAELVKKYVQILPRWQTITKEHPETYAKFKNEMQRYFGSHQCVLECFLIKAIEKTSGREAATSFIASLPNQNGFNFSEGYTIKITGAQAGTPAIIIAFKNQEWAITPELLDDIIAGGTE